MEDRDLPQDPEVRMQSRGCKAQHSGTARKPDRNPVHFQLENLPDHKADRTSPDASPDDAFTELDQYLLDELVPNRTREKRVDRLGHYILKLARLGGYLARAHDPPPGNTVVWRGLTRVTEIELGIMIGVQLVGN